MYTIHTYPVTAAEEIIFPETGKCLNHSSKRKEGKKEGRKEGKKEGRKEKDPSHVFFFLYIANPPFSLSKNNLSWELSYQETCSHSKHSFLWLVKENK
jgi:hypothetical protein